MTEMQIDADVVLIMLLSRCLIEWWIIYFFPAETWYMVGGDEIYLSELSLCGTYNGVSEKCYTDRRTKLFKIIVYDQIEKLEIMTTFYTYTSNFFFSFFFFFSCDGAEMENWKLHLSLTGTFFSFICETSHATADQQTRCDVIAHREFLLMSQLSMLQRALNYWSVYLVRYQVW